MSMRAGHVGQAGRARIVVKKFGGSSVADVDRLQKVADHVVAAHQRGERVVVVVSAMGKTTDQLVRLAHDVSPSPDRRELDMLLTAGERISMSLLAMAIRDRGVAATSLTGSQSGIITNARQGSARIVEVRPFRVEDALDDGHVVIVAGFQGVSYRREVTTLGRGGSDTTAVALAAALRADACEIYTDVDGVYSADPRVIVDARRMETMTSDEMLELARAGAKVLAEDCVAWAKASGVALYVKASDGRPGDTLVRRDAPEAAPQLSGVAVRPEAVCWRFRNAGAHRARVLALLASAGLSPLVETVVTGEATLLCARDVADAAGGGFAELCGRVDAELGGDCVDIQRGSLVSLVGSSVGRDTEVARHFDALVDDVLGADAPRFGGGLSRSALAAPEIAFALAQAVHAALLVGQETA